MMSTAYWFITGLLQPFTVLMLAVGVLVFWPQPAAAPRRRWLKISYVLLYAACTPLAAYVSTWWLERSIPRIVARPEKLDAIVVLGGSVIPSDADPQQYQLDESSLRRCQRAAAFYHAGPPCPVLVAGGILYPQGQMPPVAQLMGDSLEQLGVAAADIVMETESRTTAENAKLSAPIIREKGWQRVALVTSATHLYRSQRLFRNQGVETIPVGCQFRTEEFQWNAFAVLPRQRAIDRQHEVFHEFLGVVFLFVQGRW